MLFHLIAPYLFDLPSDQKPVDPANPTIHLRVVIEDDGFMSFSSSEVDLKKAGWSRDALTDLLSESLRASLVAGVYELTLPSVGSPTIVLQDSTETSTTSVMLLGALLQPMEQLLHGLHEVLARIQPQPMLEAQIALSIWQQVQKGRALGMPLTESTRFSFAAVCPCETIGNAMVALSDPRPGTAIQVAMPVAHSDPYYDTVARIMQAGVNRIGPQVARRVMADAAKPKYNIDQSVRTGIIKRARRRAETALRSSMESMMSQFGGLFGGRRGSRGSFNEMDGFGGFRVMNIDGADFDQLLRDPGAFLRERGIDIRG